MGMEQYTNYCTEEQTKRAYKLGAPIEEASYEDLNINYPHNPHIDVQIGMIGYAIIIPTTQQMISWLREKGIGELHIWGMLDGTYAFSFLISTEYSSKCEYSYEKYSSKVKYNSYEQAELAAIDAALDYLEKGEMK